MSPPKQSVLVETPLAKWWHRQKAIQKNAQRRCVVCDAIVTNRNLGGHHGRGAFSGSLYCVNCADLAKR